MQPSLQQDTGQLLYRFAAYALQLDNEYTEVSHKEPGSERLFELQSLRAKALGLLEEQLQIAPPWLQLRVKAPHRQVVKASHSKTPITFARPQPLSVRFAVFEKEAGEVLAYIHEKQREESASAKKQTAPPPQAAEPSPTDAGKDPSSAQTDAPDGQGAEQSTTEQAEGSAANPSEPKQPSSARASASSKLISFFKSKSLRAGSAPTTPTAEGDAAASAAARKRAPRAPSYRERLATAENTVLEAEIHAIEEEESIVHSDSDSLPSEPEALLEALTHTDACLSIAQSLNGAQDPNEDNMETSADPTAQVSDPQNANAGPTGNTGNPLIDKRPPPIACPTDRNLSSDGGVAAAEDPTVAADGARPTRPSAAGSDRSDQSRTKVAAAMLPPVAGAKPAGDVWPGSAAYVGGHGAPVGPVRDQVVGPLHRGMSRNSRTKGTGDSHPSGDGRIVSHAVGADGGPGLTSASESYWASSSGAQSSVQSRRPSQEPVVAAQAHAPVAQGPWLHAPSANLMQDIPGPQGPLAKALARMRSTSRTSGGGSAGSGSQGGASAAGAAVAVLSVSPSSTHTAATAAAGAAVGAGVASKRTTGSSAGAPGSPAGSATSASSAASLAPSDASRAPRSKKRPVMPAFLKDAVQKQRSQSLSSSIASERSLTDNNNNNTQDAGQGAGTAQQGGEEGVPRAAPAGVLASIREESSSRNGAVTPPRPEGRGDASDSASVAGTAARREIVAHPCTIDASSVSSTHTSPGMHGAAAPQHPRKTVEAPPTAPTHATLAVLADAAASGGGGPRTSIAAHPVLQSSMSHDDDHQPCYTVNSHVTCSSMVTAEHQSRAAMLHVMAGGQPMSEPHHDNNTNNATSTKTEPTHGVSEGKNETDGVKSAGGVVGAMNWVGSETASETTGVAGGKEVAWYPQPYPPVPTVPPHMAPHGAPSAAGPYGAPPHHLAGYAMMPPQPGHWQQHTHGHTGPPGAAPYYGMPYYGHPMYGPQVPPGVAWAPQAPAEAAAGRAPGSRGPSPPSAAYRAVSPATGRPVSIPGLHPATVQANMLAQGPPGPHVGVYHAQAAMYGMPQPPHMASNPRQPSPPGQYNASQAHATTAPGSNGAYSAAAETYGHGMAPQQDMATDNMQPQPQPPAVQRTQSAAPRVWAPPGVNLESIRRRSASPPHAIPGYGGPQQTQHDAGYNTQHGGGITNNNSDAYNKAHDAQNVHGGISAQGMIAQQVSMRGVGNGGMSNGGVRGVGMADTDRVEASLDGMLMAQHAQQGQRVLARDTSAGRGTALPRGAPVPVPANIPGLGKSSSARQPSPGPSTAGGAGPKPPPPPGPPPPPPPMSAGKGVVIARRGTNTSTDGGASGQKGGGRGGTADVSDAPSVASSVASAGAYTNIVDSIKALGASGGAKGHLRSLSKSQVKRGAKGEARLRESQGVTPVTLKKAPAPGAADGSSGAARATPGTGASGGGYGMLSGREVTAAQVRGSQQAIQFMQRLRDAMRPQPHDEEGESNAESDDDWN